jgi:hypothetical protein
MNDSTENANYEPIQLFQEEFNLNRTPEELDFVDVPESEDIDFDFINMDSGDLTKAKKTMFWEHLVNSLGVHLRYGEKLSIDKLISYYPSYEEPLFFLKNHFHFPVEQSYGWILKYTAIDGTETKNREAKIKKMQTVCMDKGAPLVDEIYLILIKMLRNNPEEDTIPKVWEALAFMASYQLPSDSFKYPVMNYFLTVIEHHPDPEFKMWARYVLKRVYALHKNEFKRNFVVSYMEMKYVKAKKQIPVPIFLQNGQHFYSFIESYTTTEELLNRALDYLKIPEEQRQFYCLFECIEKVTKFEERQLASPVVIGDILSSWEMLSVQYKELIKTTRIYLGMKYYPLEPKDCLFPMICSKLFDIYFNKIHLERYENSKLWALAMQMYYKDFTERPGYVRDKLSLLHHPNYEKQFSDENYLKELTDNYKDSAGRMKESCAEEILDVNESGFHKNCQHFKIMFRNSNNPNFRDMQENVIMSINSQYLTLYEEASRENILEIQLEEIANWGVNQDLIVISFGDKYEITKMYFLSHNPCDIAECLFNYSNLSSNKEYQNIYEVDQEVAKFRTNPKVRKTNNFILK